MTGSRELPLCDRVRFNVGSVFRSHAGVRDTPADPLQAEVHEIRISHCLRRFHNDDSARYGDIIVHSYDKNAELHDFWSAR